MITAPVARLRLCTLHAAVGLAALLTPAGLAAAQAAPDVIPPNYVAPRIKLAPAGRPDWSGVWSAHGLNPNIFDPAAVGRPENKGKKTQDMRDFPPYKPEWAQRYEALLAQGQAGAVLDPDAACLPPGMPRVMTTPYPFELVILPDRVDILYEISSQVRRIYTDGRKHPAPEDLDPSFNGDSIGHWEGDTLVIDTVGLVDKTVYDLTAAPHSDKVHVTERIRRLSPVLMENIMTVDDPVMLTTPWVVRRLYEPKPDWRILEYVCEDNNRNAPNADGTTGFVAR